jgi:hypothetical protein
MTRINQRQEVATQEPKSYHRNAAKKLHPVQQSLDGAMRLSKQPTLVLSELVTWHWIAQIFLMDGA